MRYMLSFIVLIGLFVSPSFAADWNRPADVALQMPPGALFSLENKKDKSEEDIYVLTIVYYREYQRTKLKNLFNAHENKFPDSPAVKWLQGIILMGDHRQRESRDILTGIIQTHPEFYPAQITLAHLDYLQKDFARACGRAVCMIEKNGELSRFHLTVSLLIAAGSKGIMTQRNLFRAIPAYFEVNGYLRKAQALMPGAAEVLYAVGSYHLLTPAIAGGNLDQAIDELEKSRQLTPLNPSIHVRLAQAYRAKGNRAASCKSMNRAVELDPQDELLVDDQSGQKAFLDVP